MLIKYGMFAHCPSAQKSVFLCHPGLRQAPSPTPYILTPKPQGKPEALQGQQDLTLLMPQAILIGLLCKLLKPTNGKDYTFLLPSHGLGVPLRTPRGHVRPETVTSSPFGQFSS